ncbi:MAG: hypothetical protein DRN29_04365 [Thermoplasmata archaeon]|nr:MAG: hypothetical protein DRN29_04365 [Thermoplasmata archaeon]
MKLALAAAFIVAFSVFIPVHFVEAGIITVNDDGTADYTSIQDAVNAAEDGDTIYVYGGYYNESVFVDKKLHFIGIEEKGILPKVMGQQSYAFYFTSPCTLQNFVIFQQKGNAIQIFNCGNITIKNSEIVAETGIYMENTTFCIIERNEIKTSTYGIYLYASDKNEIKNNDVDSSFLAFYSLSSANNTISYNNLSGISMEYSEENMVMNNVVENFDIMNSENVYVFNNSIGRLNLLYAMAIHVVNNSFEKGIFIFGNIRNWNTHIIENNRVKNSKILYYRDEKNLAIDGNDATQLILANCSDCKIYGIDFHFAERHVQIAFSENIKISNCSFSNAFIAVDVMNSQYIFLDNNIFLSNDISFRAFNCSKIVVRNNNFSYNGRAIYLEKTVENMIEKNMFMGNSFAIHLYSSKNSRIFRNNIIKNENGVYFEEAFINIIVNNNFIGNERDTFLENSLPNIFMRNYWSKWILPAPKPILCHIIIMWYIHIPYFTLDLMPRLIPVC